MTNDDDPIPFPVLRASADPTEPGRDEGPPDAWDALVAKLDTAIGIERMADIPPAQRMDVRFMAEVRKQHAILERVKAFAIDLVKMRALEHAEALPLGVPDEDAAVEYVKRAVDAHCDSLVYMFAALHHAAGKTIPLDPVMGALVQALIQFGGYIAMADDAQNSTVLVPVTP